ncbi:hypothetical protein [Halovenus salina]
MVNRKVTDGELMALLKRREEPVYDAGKVAEELDVSRPTALNRLQVLAEGRGDVRRTSIGQADVFWVEKAENEADYDDRLDFLKQSVIDEFEDKFVGLYTEPWTAVHPDDGPATGGDRIQLLVEGEPGNWKLAQGQRRLWENRRDAIPEELIIAGETQALISGTLHEQPTVPIAHVSYEPDWDIEEAVGAQWVDVAPERQALMCIGEKNYLVEPCNNAVFLDRVRVDILSPEGEGAECVDGGVLSQ